MFDKPAYRWRHKSLLPVVLPENIASISLLGLAEQRLLLDRNLDRFTDGKTALNMLLWGEKGSGKSTIVRLWSRDYFLRGLRIIEFCDDDYYSIYTLYSIFRRHKDMRFVLCFDDVTFNNNDTRYRNFKSIVEGGLETKPPNAVFAATSNRRHLVAERAADTADLYNRDEQNESTSLYTRFGLSVGFYPINKELYLEIVGYYLEKEGLTVFDGWETAAENFAIDHGGRSGRTAQQFVIYHQIQNE